MNTEQLDRDLRCVLAEQDDYRKLHLLAAALARCISDKRDAMHIESIVSVEVGRREHAFLNKETGK